MAHMIDLSDVENIGISRNNGRQTRKDGAGGLQSQRQALTNLVNQQQRPNTNFRVQPSRAVKQANASYGNKLQCTNNMPLQSTTTLTRNCKQGTLNNKISTKGQLAKQTVAMNIKSTIEIYEDITPGCNNKDTKDHEDMEVSFDRQHQQGAQQSQASNNSHNTMDLGHISKNSSNLNRSFIEPIVGGLTSRDGHNLKLVQRELVDVFDVDADDPSSHSDLDISCDEDEELEGKMSVLHHHKHIASLAFKNGLGRLQEAEDAYSLHEYKDDIYSYVREAELRYMPRVDYMKKQTDITHSMRTILVDWLIEVAEEYKLKRETFFLTVNYIDRFLSVMSVIRNKLQLLGAAAMFIAAKYEEIYPPEVGEFVYITDDTYTIKQVLQMEQAILKSLNFFVAPPTPNYFCLDLLDRLGAFRREIPGGSDDGGQWNSMAMFMLELMTVNGEEYLKFPPSLVATSCVALSHYLVKNTSCMAQLSRITKYSVYDLSECLDTLFKTLHNCPLLPQQAVRTKYSSEKHHCVAKMVLPKSLSLDIL